MKKIHFLVAASILCSAPVFSGLPMTHSYAAEKAAINQNDVKQIAESFLKTRSDIGDQKWEALKIKNILPLMDENNDATKFLVEFAEKSKLSAYAIVDISEEKGYEVVEFALGDVHPYMDLKQNEQGYYFGPLTYAKKTKHDEIIDLRYKKTITEKDLKEIRKAKKKREQNRNTNEQNRIGIESVINRDFDYISGVPDFQQDDNPTWKADCSPTAGANVMVYWANHGYPKLHTTKKWQDVANRLGTLMRTHTDKGTPISNINPALLRYAEEKGYNNFSSSMVVSPSFTSIDSQIEAGHPAIVTLEGYGYTDRTTLLHTVTVVGTESYQETSDNNRTYYNLVIHDNWKNTPTDVWISFGRGGGSIEYLHKFED